MKRFLGLAIASLVLSPSAALAEWVNISSAKEKQYDIDTSSVSYSGTLAMYEARVRLSYPDENGVTLVEVVAITDCSSGAYQNLAQLELNSKGKTINSYEPGFDAPIEQTRVGSVQHRIYNFVCPGQNVANSFEEEMLRAYMEQARANQQFYWENSREYQRSMMETVRSMRWW